MTGFPNINRPDKEKDEDYYRQFVYAICGHSLTPNYEMEAVLIDECYQFYNNTQRSADKFKYLTENEAGETYPATWFSLNQIRAKLRVLVGELISRGYDFNVQAINKEAKVRKLQAKQEMLMDMKLNPIFEQLENVTGNPSTVPNLPANEKELDNFFKRDYREVAEKIVYYALKFLDKKNYWAVTRKAAFLDLLIAGKCFIKNEIENGMPIYRRVDPRDMFHDRYAQDDLLRDSTYFGERRYMSLGQAAEKYGLDSEELKQINDMYQQWRQTSPRERNQLSFSFANTTENMQWFKMTPQGLRVMVIEAFWQDLKDLNHKIWVDKYGNEHTKPTRSQRSKEGDYEVVKKKIKVWRQATLVGGTILRKWGVMPNQQKDTSTESLHEAEPPYVGLAIDFVDGRTVSLVDQQKSLQNLKDIFAYNMQLAVSVAGHKGFVYDVAQAPQGWEPEEVVKYLKTTGIAFINSKQNGTPAQFNQFQTIDLSLSNAVTKYLDLIQWCDTQIDAITGINEARQGVLQGASQAVGTTRSALLQSNMSTTPLFGMFDIFCSRVWNQQARLVKMSWANKDKYAPIIGDVGVNFLKQDVDLVDDFAVFIEITPKLLDDEQTFHQIVLTALNAGKVEFEQALILMKEKDVTVGIEKFRKMVEDAEEKEMAKEMKLQQQQAQLQQENQQKMLDANNMSQQASLQNQQALQGMKNQAAIQQELLKQRGQALQNEM